MKHSVAGRRCIYLSLFSVDNPEAVNVMSISNIRAHEAEALVFWSSDANRQLIGKVPDAGKD